MLWVNDLCVYYGLAQAVDGLSLTLNRGEVLGLIGRNGAGKSSTLKSLIGFHQATGGREAGEVIWQDWALRSLPMAQRVRLGMGYVAEDRRVFAKLSVNDNLCVAVRAASELSRCLDDVYTLFPELYDIRHRAGGLLSGGQQQMLCIARTLMGRPQLLLLDEPSEGLAPLLVERIGGALLQLKAEGLTMVIAEQNLSFCQRLCDDFVVLQQGTCLDRVTAAEAGKNPQRLLDPLRL